MTRAITYLDGGVQDMGRPPERPPKTNWKMELVKKALFTLQHLSPHATARIIWYYFTRPGKARFKDTHLDVMQKATQTTSTYKDRKIVSYKWGNSSRKVLLIHGWRSKMGDFHRMIKALTDAGYTVEGLDMKAHGQSEGETSSLPEFLDLARAYYQENGPFDALVGYSLGGLAAGLLTAELPPEQQPHQLFLIAAPPYFRYFFQDIISDLGYNQRVFNAIRSLMERCYHRSIDSFDLRSKQESLSPADLHLIYDEDDQTIPFEKGQELGELFPTAHFVHTKGLGHYQIIAYAGVIEYLIGRLNESAKEKS